jgi:hypothetical protein
LLMGAAAISVLAGARILLSSPSVAIRQAISPFVAGTSFVQWVFGTWWIPSPVAMGIWRHVPRRWPLRYESARWSVVFPLGMYSLAPRATAARNTCPTWSRLLASRSGSQSSRGQHSRSCSPDMSPNTWHQLETATGTQVRPVGATCPGWHQGPGRRAKAAQRALSARPAQRRAGSLGPIRITAAPSRMCGPCQAARACRPMRP